MTAAAAPVPADPGALPGITVWIFDLDNTLYPAACNLFAQVDRRMTEFIARTFDLPAEEARRMQKQYFRDYGTTLRGLMLEHDINPMVFLDYVHDIDLVPVGPAPRLDRALEELGGRRIVYTNGSVDHAERVLGRLGIRRHFERIFDIVAAAYLPKPDPRPYQQLIELAGITPVNACMVEDIPRNLVPAAALGMVTVWVRSDTVTGKAGLGSGAQVRYATDDLTAWLEAVVGNRKAATAGLYPDPQGIRGIP